MDLEGKKKVDQEIWTDVVIAYLDVNDVIFGKFAFDNLQMHKDPSIFQTDGIGVRFVERHRSICPSQGSMWKITELSDTIRWNVGCHKLVGSGCVCTPMLTLSFKSS